jgi:hypothetical protein
MVEAPGKKKISIHKIILRILVSHDDIGGAFRELD